jgi:hypothetical protein
VAGDLPQRAAVRHLDRIEPRSAAVDSDLTRDLAVADRIPAPAPEFGVDAKAYSAQGREIGIHEIMERWRPFHVGSAAQHHRGSTIG